MHYPQGTFYQKHVNFALEIYVKYLLKNDEVK